MQEALTLFDSICNSRWFVKTSIVGLHSSLFGIHLEISTDSVPEQDRPVCGKAPILAAR